LMNIAHTWANEPDPLQCGRSNTLRDALRAALASQQEVAAPAEFPGWTHWQERIKSLMADAAYPESMSVFQAMSRLCNEMAQASSRVPVASVAEPVEWQSRVGGGVWRRIDPPQGESIVARVAYLQSITKNGRPVYEVRALCVHPATTQGPAADVGVGS